MARQRVETVVIIADGIATVTGFDVIGDVPEKFARAAHIIRLNFRLWCGGAALPKPGLCHLGYGKRKPTHVREWQSGDGPAKQRRFFCCRAEEKLSVWEA
ncbi:MAG TPA: hypothetical protein DCW88_11360 [Agrobacterium sp.]|nr:hypothetical protein [Agrobacterium sp.]